MDKFLWFVVVLPVLVVELELRTSLFLKGPFGRVQLCDGLEPVGTVVIMAFMDGNFLLEFPSKQSQPAIRAEQF